MSVTPGLLTKAATSVFLGALLTSLAGCGNAQKYDIGMLFPLSDPNALCKKYDGKLDAPGGISYSCMVTKKQCEAAYADYQQMVAKGTFAQQYTGVCE